MKKRKLSDKILQNKRLNKHIRKDKNYKYSTKYILNNIRFKYESKIIDKKDCKFYKFIKEKENKSELNNSSLIFKVDKVFCLKENYDITLKLILSFYRSLYEDYGRLKVLDFSECTKASNFSLSILHMFILKFGDYNNVLKRRLNYQFAEVKVRIKHPKNHEVMNELILTQIVDKPTLQVEESYVPQNSLAYIKALKNKKHYLENLKGKYCKHIVNYINQSLTRHKVELTIEGKRNIEHLVGEILSNCEDHGTLSEYYFTANLSSKKINGNLISKLNLTFMNLGYSIFENFIDSKSTNITEGMKLFTHLQNKKDIEFESFINLFVLNENISRLNKEKDDSRGTGTIVFMNSFFDLSDIDNYDPKNVPQISILSGKSSITILNDVKPFDKKGRYFISLNNENDILESPDENLLKCNSINFPGTVINFQAILNTNNFLEKLVKNENPN